MKYLSVSRSVVSFSCYFLLFQSFELSASCRSSYVNAAAGVFALSEVYNGFGLS